MGGAGSDVRAQATASPQVEGGREEGLTKRREGRRRGFSLQCALPRSIDRQASDSEAGAGEIRWERKLEIGKERKAVRYIYVVRGLEQECTTNILRAKV